MSDQVVIAMTSAAPALLLPEGTTAWRTTPDGVFRVRPPRRIAGNPIGAGDGCVAALARGLRDGTPWPELLADAVAMSASSVATPVAGAFDHDLYLQLRAVLREQA